MWEESGAFIPKIDKSKKPFTIVLPLPNASGRMHTGNILMIAIEDIMIRWHRMKGDPTLWIPGTDHAGTETQITFERELKKQEKSRFDYDRDTLYDEIWKFVQMNRELVNNQIRKMGASVDWTRYKFSLDPDVVTTVCNTFKKMHDGGLIYKDNNIVNYCPVCGTTYADIEIDFKERIDPMYYMKYGPFTIATVRPETKFRDTALAANPKDKKYKEWIDKEIEVQGLLGNVKMTIIPDPEVDPKFGTGIMKVTPAHDPHDFELGKKHNLPVTPIIDLNGRMDFSWFIEKPNQDQRFLERAKKYHGKKVIEARKLMLEDLKEDGLLIKVDENYSHSIPVCKAGHDIEPTILPNWFVKVETLKKPAHEAVKSGKVKIHPKWQEIKYHRWMENMHDWAISRQNVWGIRIPVWYDVDKNSNITVSFLNPKREIITKKLGEALKEYDLLIIKSGLQRLMVDKDAKYVVGQENPGDRYLQETDTFDTWFSSGQWPLVTLGFPNTDDFKYFYPTSVLETAWEILSKWVSRMIMFGIYLTEKPPFSDVYLHGVVKALDGRKMSKSLGNVINPEEYIEEFGVDALRMGLVVGNGTGKDFNFPRDKVIGYKKFANKLWNIARYIEGIEKPKTLETNKTESDKNILHKLEDTVKSVDVSLERFRFADAAETLYQFLWHDFADIYLEESKNRKEDAYPTLSYVLDCSLKLLHPFMPFVTEALWQELKLSSNLLILENWPTKL